MPKLQADPNCPYFKLLAGGKSGIETLVETNISGIAIASMFSEMGVPEKRMFDLSVEVTSRLLQTGKATILMP